MDTRTDPVPVLPQVTSLFLGLALLLALASFAMAGTPRWWATRGAVITNEVVLTNDFAAANLGQLKNMATAAAGELQDRLAGGAGTGVLNMVNGFDQSGNFSAVTLGQLKAVAQPFYERLADAGWPCLLPDGMTTNQFYPWTGAGAQDFAVANLGQLKYVFSFTVLKVDITKILSDQFSGADENRLPPIGTYPDKNRPMLMGCSDGTTAKIKVEATVTPTSAASHTWIGVRKQGTTTILKDYLINSGGQTAVEWDSSDGDVVYEIVAGYDFNGNDDLDPAK